jgi:hypothetical protein
MHKNRNKVPSFHVCISRKVVHPGSSDHRRLNKQEAFNGADCSGTRLMMSWFGHNAVASEQPRTKQDLECDRCGAFGAVGDWNFLQKGPLIGKRLGGSLPSARAPPLTERQLDIAQRQMQANEALLLCSCRAGGDGEQGERRLLSPSGLRLWVTTRQRPLEEIPLRDVLLIGLGAIIQGLDWGLPVHLSQTKSAVVRWSRCLDWGFS